MTSTIHNNSFTEVKLITIFIAIFAMVFFLKLRCNYLIVKAWPFTALRGHAKSLVSLQSYKNMKSFKFHMAMKKIDHF